MSFTLKKAQIQSYVEEITIVSTFFKVKKDNNEDQIEKIYL